MNCGPEILALLGSFVAGAFALVRLMLNQHRALTDRFVSFLEDLVRRQEEASANFEAAIEQLAHNVRENSALIVRFSERVNSGGQ